MVFASVGTTMPVWGIRRVDPGFIYIIEDHGRYKIGRTKRAEHRLKAAKTWLPDMNVIGFKPFWGASHHERMMHIGFANYWYAGEWFRFSEDEEIRELLIEGFRAFSDHSPDRNSVDFIYWFNGNGMAEFVIELEKQKLSLPNFRRNESDQQKRLV